MGGGKPANGDPFKTTADFAEDSSPYVIMACDPAWVMFMILPDELKISRICDGPNERGKFSNNTLLLFC